MIEFEVDSRYPISIPDNLKQELAKYRRQAKRIKVTIAPVFEGRTLNQNALFHKKLRTIELLTGYPMESAKEEIKELAISMGYPYMRNELGEPVINDEGEIAPKSTADATISEMKILFTALDEWCFRNNVDIQEVWNE